MAGVKGAGYAKQESGLVVGLFSKWRAMQGLKFF